MSQGGQHYCQTPLVPFFPFFFSSFSFSFLDPFSIFQDLPSEIPLLLFAALKGTMIPFPTYDDFWLNFESNEMKMITGQP